MSRVLVIQSGEDLVLGVGLTHADLATMQGGKSLMFDLADKLQSFQGGERPALLMLIPGRDDHDLLEQIAPFLPKPGRGGRDGE